VLRHFAPIRARATCNFCAARKLTWSQFATHEAEAFGFTEAQTRNRLKRESKADPDAPLTADDVEAQVREGFYSLLKKWE
jgi:hypothetical protein